MLILWKKKSKLCQIVYDEMSLNISCTLHDVTFLALCHLFYTLSLCNTFRFFSFPLYYFWWGVWYSRVLILGWLVVWLLGFFFQIFTKGWEPNCRILSVLCDEGRCLEPCWRMVFLLLQESRLASHLSRGTTTCVAQIILFFSPFIASPCIICCQLLPLSLLFYLNRFGFLPHWLFVVFNSLHMY